MRIVSRKYGVIRTRQQSLRDTPWRGSCVRRRHKTAYRKLITVLKNTNAMKGRETTATRDGRPDCPLGKFLQLSVGYA